MLSRYKRLCLYLEKFLAWSYVEGLLYSVTLSRSIISHSLHIHSSCDMNPRGDSKPRAELYRDRFTFYMFRTYQVRSFHILWQQRVMWKWVSEWKGYSATQCSVHNHNNFTLKLQKLQDATVCCSKPQQYHFKTTKALWWHRVLFITTTISL